MIYTAKSTSLSTVKHGRSAPKVVSRLSQRNKHATRLVHPSENLPCFVEEPEGDV